MKSGDACVQQGGGGGGGGDKFIRNVALNLVLLGLYFVLESSNGGGGFFGGGGGDGGGVHPSPAFCPASWKPGRCTLTACDKAEVDVHHFCGAWLVQTGHKMGKEDMQCGAE